MGDVLWKLDLTLDEYLAVRIAVADYWDYCLERVQECSDLDLAKEHWERRLKALGSLDTKLDEA